MRKGGSASFSPAYRLLKRREFLSLSRQGCRIQDSSFVVVFQNGQSGHSRLGVTVSKRVGNAVTRNRLKRLIREVFRNNRQSLEQNWDINVIAKPVAARLTSHEVDAALNRLFSKFKAG